MLLQGCGDNQESPLGPTAPPTAGTDDAALRADKARNAVDLGSPSASASSMMAASAVTAFGATVNSIPFAPEPGPFAHPLPGCDDCMYGNVPIGFSLTFYGKTYTSLGISTNGFISFNSRAEDGCCVGRTIPLADDFNNVIAAAWTDLSTAGGGLISYETRGRAPSRYLIVSYQDVPWCCETGTNRVSTQIILYEGSNAIEIHTANQSAGHIYTQGAEDATGTRAVFLPGRVAANYGLVNDAVRFTTVLGSWATRVPLPSARRGPATAVVNGLLYSIGGRNSSDLALKGVLAYSPGNNSWSTKTSLPAARESGNGAAAIGSTIYVAGGYDANRTLTRTLYAYNTNSNTWSTRASMPIASACGGSAVISGKLYVFTGCKLSSTGAQVAAGSLHRYDPSTNAWTTLRSAPSVHSQPAVGVIGGQLYVVGGNNAAGVAVGRLDVYDPATNLWSTLPAMPTARTAATAAVVRGELHVIGGRNGDTYLKTVEAYDPIADSWTTRAPMPTARSGLGVGVISSLVYAVGGRRNGTSLTAANERYTP
jgi:N-acetylneuraminic acid mutarotase